MAKKTATKKDTVTFSLTLPSEVCAVIDQESEEQERSRHAQVLWILKEWVRAREAKQ